MNCYGGSCGSGVARYRDRQGDTLTLTPETEAGRVWAYTDEDGVHLSLAQVEALIDDRIRMRRELRRVDL